VGNVVTQGIGVVTGLQESFSWKGVAAAAVGAGVGGAVRAEIGGQLGEGFGAKLMTGVLAGMAAGVAVGALRGGRFSMQQVAVDAFGNALGDSIVANSQPGVDWSKAPDESAAEAARLNRYAVAARGGNGEPSRDWFSGMSTRLGEGGGGPRLGGLVKPTAEELQVALRQSERDYRSTSERSVAGGGYVARSGDSISRLLGTSDPQAIGNFMRANGLSSGSLEAGRNYFVPDDVGAFGNTAALGKAVLNGDNARLPRIAARDEQRLAQNDIIIARRGAEAPPSHAAQMFASGEIPTGDSYPVPNGANLRPRPPEMRL
jgi:hypothetical protein